MTLDEFKNKWLGKKADYDGQYGGQCVDLYRFYVKEVLNFPQSPGVVGAADIWTTYLHEYFHRIDNTPEGIPTKGDIVIWNKKAGGGFGHVSIFIEGSLNEFTSLDQNWPTLSKVTLTKHTYTNVLGWLHPKVSSNQESMPTEPTGIYMYLGVKDDQEARNRLKEHLGEKEGKCNWGTEGDNGGYLGSERKSNKTLTTDLATCNLELNEHTKYSAKEIKTLNTQIEQLTTSKLESEQDLNDVMAQLNRDNYSFGRNEDGVLTATRAKYTFNEIVSIVISYLTTRNRVVKKDRDEQTTKDNTQ